MRNSLIISVGVTGFEPATTRPPDVYATGLRYTPKIKKVNGGMIEQLNYSLIQSFLHSLIFWVGDTGFEPVTSRV